MSGFKITDIANPETNPMPEEAQLLVACLIEGRVKSLAVVAEIECADGETRWIDDYWIDMDGHVTDRRAFVGSMHMMAHDMADEINFEDFVLVDGDLDDDDEDDDDD